MEKKKKANSFIIPPTYYRNSSFSITEVKPIVETPKNQLTNKVNLSGKELNKEQVSPEKKESKPETTQDIGPKVSSLSLSSIRVKKELEAQLKPEQKHHDELPVEPFTETEMLEQWLKYAQKLGNKGYKILESLMLINDPILEGTTIIHELPNESSKIDFEGEKHDLLGYLRGKLHNHTINLEIKLNETIETKKAFTAEEKYQLMRDINPALDTLRKLFDLDV